MEIHEKKRIRLPLFQPLILLLLICGLLAPGQTLQAQENTLTIVNLNEQDLRTSYMAEWFAEHLPQARIQHISLEEEQLATRLMAGDTEIDLIFGNASLIGHYAQKGVYLPLDGMRKLQDAMQASGYLPHHAPMSWNGQLYGVATNVFFYVFVPNTPLLRSLQLSWPEAPYSWEELADWAIASLKNTPYILYNQLFGADPPGQYVDHQAQRNGIVKLDTPAFRQTMQAYQRLYQAGLIDLQGETDPSNALARATHFSAGATAPLPSIAGEAANIAEVLGFYVNARTQNIDLVEAYLSAYVSQECQSRAMQGEASQRLLTEGLQQVSRYEALEGEAAYTKSNDELRVALYDGITLRGRNVYLLGALGYRNKMQDYLDGKIDLDTYIRTAQEALDMVQYE